jgi:alkanesulfonate monooxygenase SsuD/methylene tetrahydromethanopterin reductase-like flavin-dependent oxidoreductase (luciferase family)
MKFAIDTPLFGDYGDPRILAELAHEAEDSGWDGFFIWDHILAWEPIPVTDPWIALAAIAMKTARIRIGALVTPMARRHPWKLARETVALDHLSGGRLTVGVGNGSDMWKEFSTFGVSTGDRVRAAMLDEGLEVLTGLWSGEPFRFSGEHHQINETVFLPRPVQSPRIPVWVAGTWPVAKRPFRRAARWDGVAPISPDIEKPIGPAELRAIAAYIAKHRTSSAPFDILASGRTTGLRAGEDAAIVAPLAEAGATWWLESVLPWQTPFADFRARIRKGPPRVTRSR